MVGQGIDYLSTQLAGQQCQEMLQQQDTTTTWAALGAATGLPKPGLLFYLCCWGIS